MFKVTISIKWIGHASFLIKAEGRNIYIDPYEGEYVEKADIILVSHPHSDHCNPSKIKEIQESHTEVVVTKGRTPKIDGKVRNLRSGEEAIIKSIRIKAVEAYNNKRLRAPGKPYHPKGLGVGYVIAAEGQTIYHAGDTDFVPEMRQLGRIDIALLPSGGTYTMDNSEAAEAAIATNPRILIPMHRRDTDPQILKSEVEKKTSTEVVILRQAEEYQVA